MKTSYKYSIEWRYRGRWVKWDCQFLTQNEALHHAGIIGVKRFRLIKITLTENRRVERYYP